MRILTLSFDFPHPRLSKPAIAISSFSISVSLRRENNIRLANQIHVFVFRKSRSLARRVLNNQGEHKDHGVNQKLQIMYDQQIESKHRKRTKKLIDSNQSKSSTKQQILTLFPPTHSLPLSFPSRPDLPSPTLQSLDPLIRSFQSPRFLTNTTDYFLLPSLLYLLSNLRYAGVCERCARSFGSWRKRGKFRLD